MFHKYFLCNRMTPDKFLHSQYGVSGNYHMEFNLFQQVVVAGC